MHLLYCLALVPGHKSSKRYQASVMISGVTELETDVEDRDNYLQCN